MKRKLIFAALLLIMLPLSLFADEYIAFWSWTNDDPGITAYRYQLNSQDPDGWTVVGPEVTQYSYAIEDPSQDITLYVQASYDGVNWSGSSETVAPAPEPAAKEEITVEETPEVDEITAEESAAKSVNKSSRWYVSNTFGLNVLAGSWNKQSAGSLASTTLAQNSRIGIVDKVTAGYQFNDWFRLSFSAGFAYQFSKNLSSNGYIYLPFTVNTDFRVANFGSLDIWTQISVGMYDRIFGKKFQLGPMAGLGIYAEYAINDNFFIGGGISTNFFMTFYKGGTEFLWEVTPVYLSCTYMF